jgi:hypothetical protein
VFIPVVFREPDGGECSISKLADDRVSTVFQRVTKMYRMESSWPIRLYPFGRHIERLEAPL